MISKYKKITIGIIVLLIFGIIMLMLLDVRRKAYLTFSEESGYYNEPFELRILGGGSNRIYYTLDGSEPTTQDYLYDAKNPILLNDATGNENIYSARTDVSAGFLSDLIDEYSRSNPQYTVPDHNVDKCNIVRASAFDKEGNCIDSTVGIYFIGFQDKLGYEKMYTASIVTDPDNLFGYKTGIYTLGAVFDNYMETEWNQTNNWIHQCWWWWTSNYHEIGIEWEREASVAIFDEDRKLILSEDCGIRIQGGGSRGKLPKSIGCYARKTYGGSREFQTDLFSEKIYPHKFVFFSGGDDNVFKLKDYMANVLGQDLSFSTMDFIPCIVFLDGEYWGVYHIIENYNSDYISDHYNVDRDNVIMVKGGTLVEGNETDMVLFSEMQDFILNNDMSVEENYIKACNLIDIDSFIDYYAASIYIGRRGDWPKGNWAVWRTKDKDGSDYGDCRWRWMLFDVNSGSMDQMEMDAFSNVIEKDTVFSSIYQNEEFRIKFINRLLYIGSEVYSQEKCDIFLDTYAQKMKDPISVSNRRFYNDTKNEEFDQNVQAIRTFFSNRKDMIWNFIVNNAGEEWLNQNGIQK